MATNGKLAWEKYYEGNDGVNVEVKKSAAYYDSSISTKSSGTLQPKTSVIYRDILSQHIKQGGNLKIAFQFDSSGQVYYSSVDNFHKPGRTSGMSLNPKSFGIENQTFTSASSYYTTIINSLDSRLNSGEIGGELHEYLTSVLKYSKTGTIDFINIDKTKLPWGEITSYFAELAGPLACVTGHCSGLSQIISSPSSCKIYIPNDSVSLYDYKLININTNQEYLISAKQSGSVSNVVKPQFVTGPLDSITNDSALNRLKTTKSYLILKILGGNDAKSGPFLAYNTIQPQLLTKDAISNIMTVYTTNANSTKKLPEPYFLASFIEQFKGSYSVMSNKNPEDMTVGLIRYVCEQEIAKWSKTSSVNQDFKNIFEKYLNATRIVYVKMDASATKNPTFTASAGGDTNSVNRISSLELRTKNDSQSRVDDRIGYQIK